MITTCAGCSSRTTPPHYEGGVLSVRIEAERDDGWLLVVMEKCAHCGCIVGHLFTHTKKEESEEA